jgi:hypothetical protein
VRTSPGINTNLFECSPYLNLLVTSATILGSSYTAITFFPLSRRSCVKLPVPGPIYKITSVDLSADFSTILFSIWGLIRICWPNDLLKTILVFETDLDVIYFQQL